MSSSNSPCAACKFLRRKCTPGCVFAPYFPPDQPVKFANVHKVFGASNVAKLLNELAPAQREDAVNSLAYEADARLRDPVYGCVGYISLLQHHLIQLQQDLTAAKKELSVYIGSAALGPFLPHHQFHTAASQAIIPGFVLPAAVGMGLEHGNHQSVTAMYRDNHHQQQIEAQQLAEAVAAAREQEMLRSMEQQQEMARLNAGGGFVRVGDGSDVVRAAAPGEAPPPLAFVSPQMGGFEGSFLVQQQQQQQQLELQFQEAQHGHRLPHHQRKSGSDEGRSDAGPSS